MSVSYRKAEHEDITTLIDIEKTAAKLKTYSPMLEEAEWVEAMNVGAVYIIEKDGEVAGSLMYEIKTNEHVYISGIVILPIFQGQGIARESMNYILKEIGDRARIDLVTHPDNVKAIQLYESLGFKIESRKENYFGDGEPRVVMVLVKN
jgi:ribosomal protein S18 acetylase RimI-like enzyme